MSEPPRRRFLPAPGTTGYHLLLGGVALLILGPLGAVTNAYMTFSLGFAIGGQVLAGILGSTVTYGYGAEGKHGANYIQTMAASVSGVAGMGVLIQAMVWLGMPLPAAWKLALYFGCIGMFGIGVGMLYTPVLVDRLQLEYPSGHAVANILRALTDARLLRRSIGKLGGGTAAGIAMAGLVSRVSVLERAGVSASTLGAGLIVGSRIGVPTLVMGAIGWALTPWLRASGYLGPHDPFRKIGFLVGLSMIMGAGLVDIAVIGREAVRRVRAQRGSRRPVDPGGSAGAAGGGLGGGRLIAWVAFWAVALVLVSTALLGQPVGYVVFAVGLVFVFVFVNGISTGISDWNPISSAFVVSVLLMSALGLRDPVVAMMAASVLLISTSVGVDMQQDRSTGWRLGSNRAVQFRYQAVGIVLGAVLCVVLTQLFMTAYPVLRVDTFAHPEARIGVWQSAMTFKFVGAIRGLGHLAPYQVHALWLGFGIGLGTEVARKLLRASAAYRRFVDGGRTGFAVGWTVDAILLPSPYASSTGGFLDLSTSAWFAAGSVISSLMAPRLRPPRPADPVQGEGDDPHLRSPHLPQRSEGQSEGAPADELPADMSTSSLIGGGLIAGESLYTLGAGIAALLALL
ncbi:MAG TPA: OPT/YSL family transporter [Polyangia bacterium]|nr:OPT/YSL family transporter [Polyangia bacterium]